MIKLVGGNSLRLLRNGAEYFPALLECIATAQSEVWLETYIFAGDQIGHKITAALCCAAQRGATVRVLIDGFGARDMPQQLREQLRDAGVQLLVFRPNISPLTLRRQRLRRMHRKMASVDARVAFVGGINIIDDDDTPAQMPPRHDFAMRIEGPLAFAVVDRMERLWGVVAWASLQRRWRASRKPRGSPPQTGSQRAALLIRDNLRHRSDIEDAYLDAISHAREEIIIANAYFFPGRRLRRAIMAAARRDVRVILLLQGRSDHPLLQLASRALYGPLLDAGVQIFEFTAGFLHAKVAVCDQRWATVGSSNIDPFSLLLAREANVVVDDLAFTAELRGALRELMNQGAKPVPSAQWHSRPMLEKLPILAAYLLVRTLMKLFGYGERQ